MGVAASPLPDIRVTALRLGEGFRTGVPVPSPEFREKARTSVLKNLRPHSRDQ